MINQPDPGDRYGRVLAEVSGNQAVREAEAVVCEEWESALRHSLQASEKEVASRLALLDLAADRVVRAQVAADFTELADAEQAYEDAAGAATRDQMADEELHQVAEEELILLGAAESERVGASRADDAKLAQAERDAGGEH